jgi:MtaA/CmuA family methyltransferase
MEELMMSVKVEMTPKERVLAAFRREITDRIPVISPTSIATVESMKITGASFPNVHTNADEMAALAAAGHDIIGFDTVAPYFSVQQEAASLGCEVNWGNLDSMPTISTNPIGDPDDFKIPEDFLDKKPIKTVLDAIKLLKKKYGDKVAVVGKVMGPWTLSYHLHGVQDFLIETVLEPEKVHGFLDAFKEVSLKFALAQFEAGVDMLTWADHATGDLVSAKGYAEFLLPVHKYVTNQLKKYMHHYIPIILHTCGNTIDRLHYFAETGFDAFHFDSKNDPVKALEIVKDKILLTGCVNNPQTLLRGTTDEVSKEVKSIIDAGIKLVSPECAIPCSVPNINLIEIVNTAKSYK